MEVKRKKKSREQLLNFKNSYCVRPSSAFRPSPTGSADTQGFLPSCQSLGSSLPRCRKSPATRAAPKVTRAECARSPCTPETVVRVVECLTVFPSCTLHTISTACTHCHHRSSHRHTFCAPPSLPVRHYSSSSSFVTTSPHVLLTIITALTLSLAVITIH